MLNPLWSGSCPYTAYTHRAAPLITCTEGGNDPLLFAVTSEILLSRRSWVNHAERKRQNPARHKPYAVALHSVLCSTCSASERFALVLISQGAHGLRTDVECLLKKEEIVLCASLHNSPDFVGAECSTLMDVIRLGLVSSIICSSLDLVHLL